VEDGKGQPVTGQEFQRQRTAGQYMAPFIASLDVSPRTLRQARWALGWMVDGSPTISYDGDAIIQWLLRLGLSPTTRQSIWDWTRSWYKWMAATYERADLPVFGPYNFGRRKAGETRGGKHGAG
jgi:hypothetical protein